MKEEKNNTKPNKAMHFTCDDPANGGFIGGNYKKKPSFRFGSNSVMCKKCNFIFPADLEYSIFPIRK